MKLDRYHAPLALLNGLIPPPLSTKRPTDGLRAVVRNADDAHPTSSRPDAQRLDVEAVGRGRWTLRHSDRERSCFSHMPNNTASYVPATVYALLGLTTVSSAELFAKCNTLLRSAA